MQANRVVAGLTALVGLAVAVLPVAANVHWGSDTATTLGGLALVLGSAYKWLDGWQRYEGRQFEAEHYAQTLQADVPYQAMGEENFAPLPDSDDDPDPDPPAAGSARPEASLDDPDYGNE